jgi:uncharacterized Zn finger protein
MVTKKATYIEQYAKGRCPNCSEFRTTHHLDTFYNDDPVAPTIEEQYECDSCGCVFTAIAIVSEIRFS